MKHLLFFCSLGVTIASVVGVLVLSVISIARDPPDQPPERKALIGRFSESERALANARLGLSYACGFLAGQGSIINHARLPIAAPVSPESCPEFKDIATREGFDQ